MQNTAYIMHYYLYYKSHLRTMHSCTSWTSQKIVKYTVFLLLRFFFTDECGSKYFLCYYTLVLVMLSHSFLELYLIPIYVQRDSRFGSGASMEVQESCGRTWPATQDLFLVLLNFVGWELDVVRTDVPILLIMYGQLNKPSTATIWELLRTLLQTLYICCLPKCPCMIVGIILLYSLSRFISP